MRDAKDKTYRLGPALIALGHTAQESLRVNPAARAELRRLSAAYGGDGRAVGGRPGPHHGAGPGVATGGGGPGATWARAIRSPRPSG